MDLPSSAELLASLEHSQVTFEPKRCLHSLNKLSTCEACVDICPVKAIKPGKPPKLDQGLCVNCFACLPVCPTGAFTAYDMVGNLLNCAARLGADSLELVCERHPDKETGFSPERLPQASPERPAGGPVPPERPSQALPEREASDSVPRPAPAVQVHGCLAGMGVGGYLALAALGIDQISLRLDHCAQCDWAMLRADIARQIDQSNRLLAPWGLQNAVIGLEAVDSNLLERRPIWDANNPPVSRRDFFRMLAGQPQTAKVKELNPAEPAKNKSLPNKDRRRTALSITHLLKDRACQQNVSLEGLDYYEVIVSDQCEACGVCARACPTSAIEFRTEDDALFLLTFKPQNCIGCGVCVNVCRPKAVTLSPASSFAEFFGGKEKRILKYGQLTRCQRCNILIAARPGVLYCSLCDYRRKNPLGFVNPR